MRPHAVGKGEGYCFDDVWYYGGDLHNGADYQGSFLHSLRKLTGTRSLMDVLVNG